MQSVELALFGFTLHRCHFKVVFSQRYKAVTVDGLLRLVVHGYVANFSLVYNGVLCCAIK